MKSIRSLSLRFFAICALTATNVHANPAEVELTAGGVEAEADFQNKLQILRSNLTKKLPQLDPSTQESFTSVKPPVKSKNQRSVKYDKNAVKKMLASAAPLLEKLDPTLSDAALDLNLMRTAIISKATPRKLAVYVQQGADQRQKIDGLFGDEDLMKRMLVAGGAKDGRYGKALEILEDVRNQASAPLEGVMDRLALAIALEFAAPDMNGLEGVDPIARFNYYQDAYRTGELEKHFDQHSIYLLRQVVNDPHTNEEMLWMRKILKNYRPDFIDYPGNYKHPIVGLMNSEFGHKRPEWDENAPTTRLQQAIDCGGQCGPKGDFGRCLGRAYGLPIWGARLRSHTALIHWTPSGWNQILGVSFENGFWNKDQADSMTGYYFHSHAIARELPEDYLKVCRLQWISHVYDEEPINGLDPVATGEFYNSLSYMKCKLLALENDSSTPKNEQPWMNNAYSKEAPTHPELMVTPTVPDSEREITTNDEASIVIPAVATTSPQTNTDKVIFMKSYGEGNGWQLHYKRWNLPEPVVYEISVPQAGEYKLSMNVCTVNKQQFFNVTANDSDDAKRLELPYTLGDWLQSEPILLSLKQGINTIQLNRSVPKEIAGKEEFAKNSYQFSGPEFGGISIKSLVLTPVN